jgi:hypothetical protein
MPRPVVDLGPGRPRNGLGRTWSDGRQIVADSCLVSVGVDLRDDRVMRLGRGVPILRIFDGEKAKEFYIGYVGMTLDFEHRYEASLPLYMQVSRDELVLHLSEHHGDGTPGTVVYIATEDVAGFHAELTAKQYPNLRPGLEEDDDCRYVQLLDPFGNTLRFEERNAKAAE